jgi:hypothetical protein
MRAAQSSAANLANASKIKNLRCDFGGQFFFEGCQKLKDPVIHTLNIHTSQDTLNKRYLEYFQKLARGGGFHPPPWGIGLTRDYPIIALFYCCVSFVLHIHFMAEKFNTPLVHFILIS